jgi:hypothetical protein
VCGDSKRKLNDGELDSSFLETAKRDGLLFTLCASIFLSRHLGPQVPSIVEYLIKVSQAMHSPCVVGSEDPAPKRAPYCECCALSPGLCYA